MQRNDRQGARGFTLIELLMAIGLMALMTGLSWRGLDSMTRAQELVEQRTESVLTLQSGLAQWTADLDALTPQPDLPALDWDGRGFRILRRSFDTDASDLMVVAWASRTENGAAQWLRWQSQPLRTRGELQAAWAQAAKWAQNPGDADKKNEVRVVALTGWQIFYYRRDAWTNPLSSGGGAAAGEPTNPTTPASPATLTTPDAALPDGVRLVLTLPAGDAIGGTLTRDWVRTNLAGTKS